MAHSRPRVALEASTDAAALRRVGLGAGIEWCAREPVLEVVPRLVGLSAGAAGLEGSPRPASGIAGPVELVR